MCRMDVQFRYIQLFLFFYSKAYLAFLFNHVEICYSCGNRGTQTSANTRPRNAGNPFVI